MEKTIYLGIDNGYSYTKSSIGKMLPSAIIQSDANITGGTGLDIHINDIDYVIDKKGKYITNISKTDNDTDKEVLKVTTLGAIYKSVIGDIKNTDINTINVILGVGLPISNFSSQKNDFIETINTISDSDVKMGRDKKIKIKIKDIYPYPQSGAIGLLYKNEFKRNKNTMVLDLGWGTMDALLFEGIKPVSGRFKTYNALGIGKLYSKLATILSNEFKVEVDKFEIENILKDKCIFIKGIKHTLECLNQELMEYAQKIIDLVQIDLPEVNTVKEVYIIGGGADAVFNILKYNFIPHAVIVENPQFTNADSFEEVAKNMDKLKNKK